MEGRFAVWKPSSASGAPEAGIASRSAATFDLCTGDWSDSSQKWRKRPDVATAVGNKKSKEDEGRFWMALEDFRGRFRTVDLCRVKSGQLKERNVLKERTAAESAADAEAAALEDDWLAEIPGAKRSHDNASKAPKKQSSSKKKSKKKKHKKR